MGFIRKNLLLLTLITIWTFTSIMLFSLNGDKQKVPPPKEKVDLFDLNPKMLNLGKIMIGETVLKKVTVTNISDSLIFIDRVEATCGCTAVTPDKKTIRPGEKTSVDVKLTADRKKEPGVFLYAIYISCNHSESGKSQLKLVEIEGEFVESKNFQN